MGTTDRSVEPVPGRLRRAGGRCGPAVVEGTLLALVLLAFTRLHTVVAQDVAAANANARAVQSVEQRLHLDIELATNRWLTAHSALIPPAVLLYRLYYAALLGLLVWVFVRHADVYLRVRRALVAMIGLALLVFRLFPASPPRFALPGVVDVVAEHDIVESGPSGDMSSSMNLTAMPSLHVSWSLWCAYVLWLAYRGSHPRATLLAWLFPVAMAADVVATGNHYVLDVAGAGVLVLASIATATAWGGLVDRPSSVSV